MPRDKTKSQSRQRQHGSERPEARAEAAKKFWAGLSLSQKSQTLRFSEPKLVGRLWDIRNDLFVSDFTCYACGIRGQDLPRQLGMDMFAVQGICSEEGLLDEGIFYARKLLVQKNDFFEFLEQQLGSPFLFGRPALMCQDWLGLFKKTPNTWSEFLCQLLKLVELAVLQASAGSQESVPDLPAPSKWARRRARKKQATGATQDDTAEESCPVCDGTQKLLSAPCPLCVDEEAGGRIASFDTKDGLAGEQADTSVEDAESTAGFADEEPAESTEGSVHEESEAGAEGNVQSAVRILDQKASSHFADTAEALEPFELSQKIQQLSPSGAREQPEQSWHVQPERLWLQQSRDSDYDLVPSTAESLALSILFEELVPIAIDIVVKRTFLHAVPVYQSSQRRRAASLPSRTEATLTLAGPKTQCNSIVQV